MARGQAAPRRALRALVAWSLVCRPAALKLAERAAAVGADWVESTIRRREEWAGTVKACAQQNQSSEATANHGKTLLDETEPLGAGTYDDFSDLPPALLSWAAQEASKSCPGGCLLQPADRRDEAENATNSSPNQHLLAPRYEYPLTTGECKEIPGRATGHQTCKFENLYALDGAFYAHVLDAARFPADSTRVIVQSGMGPMELRFLMNIKVHPSMEHFLEHMKLIQYPLEELEGLTVAVQPVWHFNIGHALYDTMYPAFVSATLWQDALERFRLLFLGNENPPNVEKRIPGAFARNEALLGELAGNGLVRQWWLKTLPRFRHARFDAVVHGVGPFSQKMDVSANFTLGAGRDLGASRLFRSLAYNRLNIEPRASPGDRLKGIIIQNVRWGKTKHLWVDPVIKKAAAAAVDLQFIEWGKKEGVEMAKAPSPESSAFREQLLLISQTDIHISGPGTAMMYQQFLPDGAVHINMGEDPTNPRHFMEEHMAEGTPYIRALYYWSRSADYNGVYRQLYTNSEAMRYDPDRIMSLVLEARDLIRGGFEIPVPVNVNLSPVLRVLKAYEYLTQDQASLQRLTPLRQLDPWATVVPGSFATNTFKSHYPHEFLRRTEQIFGEKNNNTLNHCLLEALAKDYGEPCPGCAWGFP